jgi:hypothetical protein
MQLDFGSMRAANCIGQRFLPVPILPFNHVLHTPVLAFSNIRWPSFLSFIPLGFVV